MARKRKELPILNDVCISDVAAEGKSLARVDDYVVFVPYGAPGDIVDIKLERKKKSYAEGRIIEYKKYSDIRIAPKCEHFGTCGGCKWQHLPYGEQLKFKQKQVSDALTRIAKVDLPEIQETLGSENVWEYRNKMEYTFSNKKWISFEELHSGVEISNRDGAGFHIPGAFDKVLDINRCHLQNEIGDKIRLFIKNFAIEHNYSFYDLKAQQGFLRTLMIRTASTGEIMVLIAFGENNTAWIEEIMHAVKVAFPEITSLLYVVNTKCNDTFGDLDIVTYAGKDYITEEMDGLKFRVGPKSFYQTNSLQALRLYSVARDFAELTGRELVYDLYTGTGTIANFVARNASKVIGIEYVEDAIADAKINSQMNGIDNTIFYAGDMKDVLNDDFIEHHGRPDVMIVDPPRAGMHEDVVNVILRAKPRRIVYVSCNPATQARDLALLDSLYKVDAVQPVDMFPHTHHVENVVKLTLRQ
ncbi:MAG: 23S rRNA (uracil(1939)-C(5))-methyltransferase RlmD [Paramuribaculum sp.]|nr:23S rRNA (uracil(1939)-C(5))-methyltransferase RlmD [Paramuribaculum sp.]